MAHQFWRIRILRDGNLYGDGKWHVGIGNLTFLDAAMLPLSPTMVSSSPCHPKHTVEKAFDGRSDTYTSLDGAALHERQGYVWISVRFNEPVSPAFVRYTTDGVSGATVFTIDWSDDGLIWHENIRHTSGRFSTVVLVPTGNHIRVPLDGEYPLWRVRLLTDSGMMGTHHYQDFSNLAFLDQAGEMISPKAVFSSHYDGRVSEVDGAFSDARLRLVTDGLHGGQKSECFVGIYSDLFRASKVQFRAPINGEGKISFVVESSSNGREWFQEGLYINHSYHGNALLTFAISGFRERSFIDDVHAVIPERAGHRGWQVICHEDNFPFSDVAFLDSQGEMIPLVGRPAEGSETAFDGDAGTIKTGGAAFQFIVPMAVAFVKITQFPNSEHTESRSFAVRYNDDGDWKPMCHYHGITGWQSGVSIALPVPPVPTAEPIVGWDLGRWSKL